MAALNVADRWVAFQDDDREIVQLLRSFAEIKHCLLQGADDLVTGFIPISAYDLQQAIDSELLSAWSTPLVKTIRDQDEEIPGGEVKRFRSFYGKVCDNSHRQGIGENAYESVFLGHIVK